jgi:hypothetical protein
MNQPGIPTACDSLLEFRTCDCGTRSRRPDATTRTGGCQDSLCSVHDFLCNMMSRRAISMDILHFAARLLVIQAASGCQTGSYPNPGGSAILLVRRAVPGSFGFASRRTARCAATINPRSAGQKRVDAAHPWVPVVGTASALDGHAAASTDGHVSHDADRFASRHIRRAAAARDARSAGTAFPVPKYISSGVCPRNAECGSTRLCSST